jgi:hypothetical protein
MEFLFPRSVHLVFPEYSGAEVLCQGHGVECGLALSILVPARDSL